MTSTAARFAARWNIPEQDALRIRDDLLTQIRREWPMLSLRDLGADCWSAVDLGMRLLQASGADLRPLPEEVQAVIRPNSPQHRLELRGSAGDLPEGVICFDGRAMYLGCCDKIGCAGGEWRHQRSFSGTDMGLARVQFTVPGNWAKVGILPVKASDGVSWQWPEGGRHETWANLQEVRMAQKAGWSVAVTEALVWGQGDPLGAWSGRLQKLYLQASQAGDEALARCIRSIAVMTIGEMHTPWRKDKELAEVLPDSPLVTLDSVRGVVPGGVTIERLVAKSRPSECYHPEWSTMIWTRARCRVLRALLSVPTEAILGVRGDAIYIDGRAWNLLAGLPDFRGAGECGRLRLAWADRLPRGRVRTWADLNSGEA